MAIMARMKRVLIRKMLDSCQQMGKDSTMQDNSGDLGSIEVLTKAIERLIEEYPQLNTLQNEIDQMLFKASDHKSRQEIINILYHCRRNELFEKINNLDQVVNDVKAVIESSLQNKNEDTSISV